MKKFLRKKGAWIFLATAMAVTGAICQNTYMMEVKAESEEQVPDIIKSQCAQVRRFPAEIEATLSGQEEKPQTNGTAGDDEGTSFSIDKKTNWLTGLPSQLRITQGQRMKVMNAICMEKSGGNIAVSNAGKNNWTIVAKSGGKASVKIYGKDKKGNELSSPKSVTLTVVPKATYFKSAKPAKKKLKLTWTKQAGVSGYQIQYSTYKNFKKAKTVTIKGGWKGSKTISKLKRKKTYYVRIRTYSNSVQYCSNWSGVKKVKVK